MEYVRASRYSVRLGRKPASRQFLTGGKICKCAEGRPQALMSGFYLGPRNAIIVKN